MREVPLNDEVRETPPAPEPKPLRLSAADKKLRDAIASYYSTAGLVVAGIGMQRGDQRFSASGHTLVEKSDSIAETWIKLASQNDKVKKALRAFVETSTVAELVGLHIACLTPFIVGVIPPDFAAGLTTAVEGSPNSNGNGSGEPPII